MQKCDTSNNSSSSLVLSGNAYNNFANTMKSEYTSQQYNRSLKRFMEYCNITDVNNLMVIADKQQRVIAHKISAISINQYVAAIIHFYAMNDVMLNRKRIARYLPERLRRHKDRAYTTQEIAKLLEFCDLRNRALASYSSSLVSINAAHLSIVSGI